MNRPEFDRLVRRLTRDIPAEYLEGIAAIDVSPRAVPHPIHGDVYTLGECIPMHGDLDEVVSRVVLYHGSFLALAESQPDFSWRDEAWDTLTHELKHHLEWRANADRLEDFDWAAGQNFARLEGEPFDPVFPLSGEEIATGVYRIDDDVFLDTVVKRAPRSLEFVWHGSRYSVDLPSDALPLFVTVRGVADPPPGELVLAVRRRPQLRDLFRRAQPPSVAEVHARNLGRC